MRNGRVNPAAAAVAGILGLLMVGKASEEGTLALMHKCRGEKKAVTAIWTEMQSAAFMRKKAV